MPDRVCHACGAPVTIEPFVARDAECTRCGADLRACRNCRHWNERLHNQCAETEAEPVADRLRRNFCEFFAYSLAPFASPGAARDRAAEARAKLDALFRKDPPAGS